MSLLEPGDECPDCGATEYGSNDAICKARAGNLMCRTCGSTFEYVARELRELIEDWRDEGELYLESDVDSEQGMALQQLKCADELEDLLNDD